MNLSSDATFSPDSEKKESEGRYRRRPWERGQLRYQWGEIGPFFEIRGTFA